MCHTPTPCPMLLGKSGKCGHQVVHGRDACWRRDGRWEDKPKGKPITEAFDELSREIGPLFAHIEDADKLVDELRSDEDDA
jgi:hypothetical protein